ncbi:MAG: hypothetical protein AAF512_25025, partial [Pseudomonadota bacterium]
MKYFLRLTFGVIAIFVSAHALAADVASKEMVIPPGSERLYNDLHFAPAVKANGFIFLSGELGLNADGSVPEDI